MSFTKKKSSFVTYTDEPKDAEKTTEVVDEEPKGETGDDDGEFGDVQFEVDMEEDGV